MDRWCAHRFGFCCEYDSVMVCCFLCTRVLQLRSFVTIVHQAQFRNETSCTGQGLCRCAQVPQSTYWSDCLFHASSATFITITYRVVHAGAAWPVLEQAICGSAVCTLVHQHAFQLH